MSRCISKKRCSCRLIPICHGEHLSKEVQENKLVIIFTADWLVENTFLLMCTDQWLRSLQIQHRLKMYCTLLVEIWDALRLDIVKVIAASTRVTPASRILWSDPCKLLSLQSDGASWWTTEPVIMSLAALMMCHSALAKCTEVVCPFLSPRLLPIKVIGVQPGRKGCPTSTLLDALSRTASVFSTWQS